MTVDIRLRSDGLPSHSSKGTGCYQLLSEGWWTRSQSIRTEGEVPFEAALVDLSDVPNYVTIAEKVLHLQELTLSVNRIAAILGVDWKTVGRASRWIRGMPVYRKESPSPKK
jgi:hypothetical protein